jgi:hypothetical protein
MALSTKTYTAEPVDLSTADDDLLREVVTLTNAIADERVPEDPPISFEAFPSRVRNRPVLPTHRLKGVARQVLRELVAGAGPADDIVRSFFTSDRVPAADAFLERLGAKRALTMHANQLDLSTLDRAPMLAINNGLGFKPAWASPSGSSASSTPAATSGVPEGLGKPAPLRRRPDWRRLDGEARDQSS